MKEPYAIYSHVTHPILRLQTPGLLYGAETTLPNQHAHYRIEQQISHVSVSPEFTKNKVAYTELKCKVYSYISASSSSSSCSSGRSQTIVVVPAVRRAADFVSK